MKTRKIITLALIVSTSLSVSLIGYSGWLLGNNNSKQYDKSPNGQVAVCKINSVYYTSIGKAIESSKSGDVIEVIPGNTDRNNANYFISTKNSSKELTIPEGVTLNIPYELGVANNKIANGANGVHALANREKYCKSSVVIDDGITLINNGKIEIGGLIGAGAGGTPSGCTAGNYSELILGINSTLINHNEINLYGYLGEKEDNKSDFMLKPDELSNVRPKLNMPMYWYDFAGGSLLKAIYDAIGTRYCMPIDDFYFENNAVKTTIYGGTDIISWVNLYAASNNGEYDLKLVGSDANGVINLPAGSYLESNFNEVTLINELNFYGDTSFNALNINVEKAINDSAGPLAWGLAQAAGIPSKVTSDDGYFPLSYHFDITLNTLKNQTNAVFNASSNRYKFLNGSNLKINNGVELNCKELIAYKGDDIYTGRGSILQVIKKSKKPLIPANVQVEGKLAAQKIAGHLYANNPGGWIIASNATSVTMYEPKNAEEKKILGIKSTKMLNNEQGWFYIPLTLNLKNANGLIEDKVTGNYNCVSTDCYWEDVSIVIKESNDNYESGKRKAATFNIVTEVNPNNYASKITSFEWHQERHDKKVSKDGVFAEDSTFKNAVFETIANENVSKDNLIDVWLEVTFEGQKNPVKSNVITFNARYKIF